MAVKQIYWSLYCTLYSSIQELFNSLYIAHLVQTVYLKSVIQCKVCQVVGISITVVAMETSHGSLTCYEFVTKRSRRIIFMAACNGDMSFCHQTTHRTCWFEISLFHHNDNVRPDQFHHHLLLKQILLYATSTNLLLIIVVVYRESDKMTMLFGVNFFS